MLGSLLGSPGVGPTGSAGPTHLRLISQGQEISQELDERTLAELGFKVASMHIETKKNSISFSFCRTCSLFLPLWVLVLPEED